MSDNSRDLTTPRPTQATVPPISDSPWFWAYVFACGGLIALMLMGPKYTARQSQIDRKTEKRLQVSRARAAGEQGLGSGGSESARDAVSRDDARADQPGISLTPLTAAMLLILSIAFYRFQRRRVRAVNHPPSQVDPS